MDKKIKTPYVFRVDTIATVKKMKEGQAYFFDFKKGLTPSTLMTAIHRLIKMGYEIEHKAVLGGREVTLISRPKEQ